MRKFDAATAAKKIMLPAVRRDEAAVQLVCLALTASLVALACRILSIW
jgi:hypothetical protein